ncbi:MAG: TIGR00296 family protein [Candidatus Bathyarchaeia archaeon]
MTGEFTLTLEEGDFLVKLARASIEAHLNKRTRLQPPKETPPKLREKCGIFVTLNKISREEGKTLRGCIGYPEPVMPLVEAIIDAAVSAAVRDPRFPPVAKSELTDILVEVSVLTPLQLLSAASPKDYPQQIRIGVDGLVVEKDMFKGLLLPQVPVEWSWDSQEFLSNCCMKAGLPPDAWLLPGTKVYKFQALIFAEKEPLGAIEQVSLAES